MSWYPKAVRKEIRPGSNDPPIRVVGAILHVAVSNADSLYSYFNGPSGGIESNFYVRRDGAVEQYRDTGREADANLKANSFTRDGVRCGFVSIETAGLESGEWNAAQLASIEALLVWLSREHGFPLRRCPGPFESGVGYHVMWGAPGPWTPVSKSCPGPDRVRQFRALLEPWMAEQGRPEPVVKPAPTRRAPKFPGADAFRIGRRDLDVTRLGHWLIAAGFAKHHDGNGYQAGSTFTKYDMANVADFQRSVPELAGDPDGIPGPRTWALLWKAAQS